MQRPLKKGSSYMVQKRVAFAPACQKQLGSRLRSPLLRRATMPAQPFSRFFTIQPIAKQGTRRSRASSMSERSELRSRREERMENGVKNMKGARLFPKTFSNHGFRDASLSYLSIDTQASAFYTSINQNGAFIIVRMLKK